MSEEMMFKFLMAMAEAAAAVAARRHPDDPAAALRYVAYELRSEADG